MMLISKIGEFGLIERIKRGFRCSSSVVVGPGDDCAVLKYDKLHYQLATCDMLVEGVDFTRKDDLRLVGRKALGVCASDIASCAGLPAYALVSLALPRRATVEMADRLCEGMAQAAREFSISVIGGDISRSDKIHIDVSMLGTVEKKLLTLRKGARPGDLIAVTGALGGSIRGKHLKFSPRIRQARYLAKNFKITSMIDVSDGLVQDLGHILKAGNVGAQLYEELIPLEREAHSLAEALYMGEDFELLFTLSAGQAKRLTGSARHKFSVIGRVCKEDMGFKLINRHGRQLPLDPAGGWRHF